MNRLNKLRLLKIRYYIACVLGKSQSKWLRKHKIFAEFGDNVLYTPKTIPNNPKLVKIHNNVKIAAGVSFYEHDVINQVFRDMEDGVNYRRHMSSIEIMDNVFIGAHSIIIGNVKIGPNAIIGAGSVVTKDVAEGTVVAGNPATVVGDFESFYQNRIKLDGNKENLSDKQRYDEIWTEFYKNIRKKCDDKRK